jgi:YidC/Oxa1 family membrane protein insertase
MIVFANVLQPLIDVAHAILRAFHDQLGFGWGAAIIGLTVAVRILILPLTFKGVRSMQAMQELQPEIKKIQERYRDDRQRMNQEMMRFYQEHQINPLSSCLPLALQIPVFISLFYLLQSQEFKADIKGEESFLFIPDLAAPMTSHAGVLVVLLVLYVGSQLAASAVTAVSADKRQRIIFLVLPFVIIPFVIVGEFQFALMVYWITTNVWTVGQQLAVKRFLPPPEPPAPDKGEDDRTATEGKPARGKPTTAAAPDDGPNGRGPRTDSPRPAKAEDGRPAKAPPRSPRKKKKRSGRRR